MNSHSPGAEWNIYSIGIPDATEVEAGEPQRWIEQNIIETELPMRAVRGGEGPIRKHGLLEAGIADKVSTVPAREASRTSPSRLISMAS